MHYFAGPYDKEMYDAMLTGRVLYHSFWVDIDELDILHDMETYWDDEDEDENRAMIMGANGGCRRYNNKNQAKQTLMRLAFGDEENFYG